MTIISSVIVDELDRDLASKLGVVGKEDLAHAALAEALKDPIAGCAIQTQLHRGKELAR